MERKENFQIYLFFQFHFRIVNAVRTIHVKASFETYILIIY